MAAEYAVRVHGLCTKLSGRWRKGLEGGHFSCHKRRTRVLEEKARTYFRVIRSVVLCSARSGMQRSSSSQPFQKGSWPKTKSFLGRRNWKFILWSDFGAISSLSPPSSLQWANCHLELVRGRSPGAPLGQRTQWAVHSLWSPDQNNTRMTQIVLILTNSKEKIFGKLFNQKLSDWSASCIIIKWEWEV